ncbi:MAG TPA: DUF2892 domain-containing protein [Candidatus Saccharimonadia bacterium]|nr:DUF2892 domain-containing protein [Candidatus Saccharimonadia bacterium]
MSLTYQPFAAVPEVVALGKELKSNVHDVERAASVIAGVAAIFGAMRARGGLERLLGLATAGAFIYRGVTGHCHAYDWLGIRTREIEQHRDPAESSGILPEDGGALEFGHKTAA